MGVCSRCHEKYMTVIAERDEALAKYQFMVDRAADEKLDGYRELAARIAAAENERDLWERRARAAVAAMDTRLHTRECVKQSAYNFSCQCIIALPKDENE